LKPSSTPLLVFALLALLVLGYAPLIEACRPLVQRALEEGPRVFFAEVYDARTLELLGKTALLGLAAATLAMLFGAPFGFFVARTDVPGASFLRSAGMVPLILPPLVLAMTWTMLVDERGPRMTALLLGLATFPAVALFTARAFEQIDARKEEAALLAGGLGAVLRMELPLVLPSILAGGCIAFSLAVNDFSLPDYVSSVGKKFGVYATEVFTASKVDGNRARATAIALPLVLLTMLALAPALLFRRRDSAAASGDFQRPAPLSLGHARWAAFAFCAGLVFLGAVVPIARLCFEAGGGSRLFGQGSIRRAAWTQGGGAAQVSPGAASVLTPGSSTGPSSISGAPVKSVGDTRVVAASDAASRASAVEAAAAAARLANARATGAVKPPVPEVPTQAAPRPKEPSPSPSSVPARAAENSTVFVPAPTNSAAAGSFRPDTPEALAARAAEAAAQAEGAQQPANRGPLLPRLRRFASNVQGSFARALELSRGSLLMSLFIAAAAATVAAPLALILGHAAARRRQGRLLELLAIVPFAAPAILFGIGAIGVWNHDATAAVYESSALVVLLYVGRFLVFPMLALSRATATVDVRLEEAAALAGVSAPRRLAAIVTPNVLPALAGAWTLVFVLSVRELDAAILVPAANDTVLFRIFNAVHFGRDDFVAALCLLVVFVLLLPGMLWSLFTRKRLEFLP